jgi:nicotinate-nucleotide adenylyltransferase
MKMIEKNKQNEFNCQLCRNDILKMLSLSQRRFEHTLGTERAALELARIHHPELDVRMVSFAALFHDMTKEYSVEEHIEVANRHGIVFTEEELSSPKLLHSKTASYICRYELNLDDDICDAVYYHTTGRIKMSPLEEIVYFADYIEDTRTDEECVALRNSYFELLKKYDARMAFDKALVLSFDRTIINLMKKGYLIDKNTLDARNYYLSRTINTKNISH